MHNYNLRRPDGGGSFPVPVAPFHAGLRHLKMENIVFFGKGGIGKSTISSNVTAALAARGGRILHIGLDPKMDSTLSLMGRGISPFTASGLLEDEATLRKSIHPSPIKGVFCIEAGGPDPGLGCAGAGISAMLDTILSVSLLEKDDYDAAVFDVLGDVVCGGFAAPLRRGFARKAVIVVSEEILVLYAANRLIKMVENYSRNGVYLAGLAANLKSESGLKLVQDFARAVNTKVLGVVLRSDAITRAEKARRAVVLQDPRSDAAARLRKLSVAVAVARPPASPARAMSDQEIAAFLKGEAARHRLPPAPPRAAAPVSRPDPGQLRELLEKTGFRLSGIAGGQVQCRTQFGGRSAKVLIVPAGRCAEGMQVVNDWGICFSPEEKTITRELDKKVRAAAAGLKALRFDDFIAAFCGSGDFYGNVLAYNLSGNTSGDRPPDRPYYAYGQWQRFLFTSCDGGFIPPGFPIVEHGDLECRFSFYNVTPLSMFQTWGGLPGTPGTSPVPRLPKHEQGVFSTGFNTADAFGGDEAKLTRALEFAAGKTGKGGLVELYMCCPSYMVAGDVRAPVERVSREKNIKVAIETCNSLTVPSPAKIAARAEFAEKELASRGRRKPVRDVNFINFGDARRALAPLLEQSGLSLLAPTPDFYADILSARLQVLPEPEPSLVKAFERRGIKWVSPPAPYGFGATAKWLSAIYSALGRAPGRAPRPPRGLLTLSRELAARCSGFSAGFVASPEELGALNSSRFPVLGFMAEAGFRLKLMLYAADAEAERKARARAAALRAGLAGARLETLLFRTPQQLAAALAGDPKMRLVYSDVVADRRIISTGKNVLSPSVFEPGYEGALETVTRLLRLCDWNFYERYLR